ncbi:MAG TPA: OmcA/MtrC family decaheme c-type cytochrome, partial [Ilumatobacteraceae bacterium]|nr:OmcA/MtrC family decaheme c-type cytochrome [Ilumatobacteraceae bacterium]
TDDPDEARLRLTIARLDVDSTTQEGLTTTFTRYRSYITSPQTSPITSVTSNLPGYDSGGTLTAVDPSTGTWRYTFKNPLPEGFDASRTHTVGGQVEREVEGTTLAANPVFDFVPAGGSVTTVREVVTTAQCNSCHNPLEAHGGSRREVRLCQLCHTDQAPDPDTGNSIALLDMVHRIHRGRDLPSINASGSPVGTKYEIIGFNQSSHVFGEKIKACVGGAFNGITCGNDADCGNAGTCTGTTTVGVGFPRDIRGCETCHASGATAADYLQKPSTATCTSCHDDVNPGQTPTAAGAPGTNHVAGAQPDTLCRVCHTPTGGEFDISVPGAHTIPAHSTAAPQLAAELLSASGAATTPITVTFRLTDGAGTPLPSLEGLDTVRFNASGPTTDLGGTTPPIVAGTAQASSGETGTLTGPDGNGVYTYVYGTLPAAAAGSWRVGIEARTASVTLPSGDSVRGTAPNQVLDFSVDGSSVVPRRTITSTDKCAACHGTFSADFSIHGGLRNNVEYCGICHHPRSTDFSSRNTQLPFGADPDSESIHLKVLLHKLHTGEDLDQTLYIVYGRQGRPVDLGEVRFPGDRRDCATCHVDDSQLLPLPDGLLPTRLTTNDAGAEVTVEERPPVTAACITCHGDESALAHARANTFGGTEACQVCHGEGRVVAVSEVHKRGE